MSEIKLKVCGMKLNTFEVASLQTDYLGFIFYDKSPRFFSGEIPELAPGISKVGVFVNASIEEISEKINKYKLEVVQLHGEEAPEFCKELKEKFRNESITIEMPSLSTSPTESFWRGVEEPALSTSPTESFWRGVEEPALSASPTESFWRGVEVWKVFSIKDSFDFDVLKPYEDAVDKFLFDTKGKEKGGNGYTFNWEVLNDYPSTKPFVLSGGIGLEEIEDLKKILLTKLPVHAIDVNSRFETEPGLKNIDDLNEMINWLKTVND